VLKITLENFRTFVAPAPVELRPLTLLTGENSSGKTTFLAAIAAICDQTSYPFAPGFNRDPFSLGTFETIATHKGGELGHATSFSIGYVTDSPAHDVPHAANATYHSAEGQPELARFEFSRNGTTVILDAGDSDRRAYTGTITARTAGADDITVPFSIARRLGEDRSVSLADLLLTQVVVDVADEKSARQARDLLRRGELFTRVMSIGSRFAPRQATPIAPIRSRPERIYGQIAETFQPTGDHVPFVINRLLRDDVRSPEALALAEWLAQALRRFGEESGLFKNLRVKKLGTKPDDPFQLLVSIAGRDVNLVDVGYGVSQSLPVIVETVLALPSDIVLLQQPEVHLHPRGQAALGTYFADLVRNAGKYLVVETHSDFLIDRVRQEVAAGRLDPQDVALLFFERLPFETKIHRLDLDSRGNITNPPPTYRSFFLEEELNLLSR
jgi:predicted ATPase